MTLIELITELRNLLEDTGGHGIDWVNINNEHLLKWTNSELVLFLNEAEKEVARRTHILFDSETPEIVEIPVLVDEGSYVLHPSIIRIRRAKLDSQTRALDMTSWRDQEALDPDWENKNGTARSLIRDWSFGRIRLVAIPAIADTLRLSVYRLPLEDMEWTQRASAEPEIPIEYHQKLLYWAAHLAYEKDEPNTEDAKRSEIFELKFEREIGPKEDAYSQERKKRTKRNIAYGGIR